MKFAPMKRLAVVSLAVAGVYVVGLNVGCDDASKANKAVVQKIASSNAKMAAEH